MLNWKKYKIDDSDFQKEIDNKIHASKELVKALRISYGFNKLQEEVGISEEKSFLIVPLRDGPIPAIYIIEKGYESKIGGKHIDEIIPYYIDYESDLSRAQIICSPSIIKSKINKNILPLSACYDGEAGEPLLNCVEKISQISYSIKQLAINVKIRESRFPQIQRTLDKYYLNVDLDYGYIENSQITLDVAGNKWFPKGWEYIDQKYTDEAKSKIFNFLNLKYGDSPLRNVEIIRASIIGLVEINQNGIEYLNLLNTLKELFEGRGLKFLDNIKPNPLITRIIDSMRETKILDLKNIHNKNIINKGTNWNDFKYILEPYITYFKNIYKG